MRTIVGRSSSIGVGGAVCVRSAAPVSVGRSVCVGATTIVASVGTTVVCKFISRLRITSIRSSSLTTVTINARVDLVTGVGAVRASVGRGRVVGVLVARDGFLDLVQKMRHFGRCGLIKELLSDCSWIRLLFCVNLLFCFLFWSGILDQNRVSGGIYTLEAETHPILWIL